MPLKKYRLEVLPTAFVDGCAYLEALFQNIKVQDPSYSFKAFGIDLGFKDPSNFFNLARGRRPFTRRSAATIAANIGLVGDQKQYFLKLIDLSIAPDSDLRNQILDEMFRLREKIGDDSLATTQFQLFQSWYHPVVRELLAIPGIDQSASSIAALLKPKVRASAVAKSIDLLIELMLIRYNSKTGRLEPTSNQLKTPPEIEDLLASRYHQSMLELSKDSVLTCSEAQREISGTTFRVAAHQVVGLKEKLYKLQMDILAAEPHPSESDQIYQLNFQLFPVSSSIEVADQGDGEVEHAGESEAS